MTEKAPLPSSDYEEKVIYWRKRCFLQLGFDEHWAEELAKCKIDHHKAEKMLKSGCSRDLARSILL